jgi:hypothetical protein
MDMSELRSLARQRRHPNFGVLLSELAMRQSASPTAQACCQHDRNMTAGQLRLTLSPACAHFARREAIAAPALRGCSSFNPAVAAMVITHDQPS